MNSFALLFKYGVQYGALLSAVLSVIVLTSLWINAEMWLHDAPKAVQMAHGPISAQAKRQRVWAATLVFGAIIGISWWAIAHIPNATGIALSFGSVFTALFVIFMTFNLVDLLLLDWLIIEYWRPPFLSTPKLSALMSEPNYLFHFLGFLKGTVMLGGIALAVAGLVAWLS